MPVDPRTPCLVGVAQRTDRSGAGVEPLDAQVAVARAAVDDSGAPALLDRLDSLQVVYCQTWPYDDPTGRLGARLGVDPKHTLYSGIGGTTPQVLLNDTAAAIVRGELDVALVVGAEALNTMRQIKKTGERAPWSHRDPEKKPFPFEAMPHESEIAHEVFQAWLTFAVLDIARRGARGAAPDDYRDAIGRMMAPMTGTAAANPHAWFPVERSAEELVTPTPGNRLVGYPYTKYTVSVMDVDMAAAVVMTSAAAADGLGIAEEKRVYLRGWAYGTDAWHLAQRGDLAGSPAMAAVFRDAFAMAGVGLDDVGHFDLYSCFASSLHFATDALCLHPLDPRGLTVTGGLPFAGGPASNYMLHSVAAMAERLRSDPGGTGLVSGVGMHMTKHVGAVYSTTPSAIALPDPNALKAELKAIPLKTITASYAGPATVAAYSVTHGRDGSAEWGLLVCDLPDGSRAYARVEDTALLADAEARELVGQAVDVDTDGQRNTARW